MKVAIEPQYVAEFAAAVEDAGGRPCRLQPDVEGLVWTDYHQPDLLAQTLEQNPQLTWLQLPFAGVDAFQSIVRRSDLTITCAKGAYREPVAEHALTLCLALGRAIPDRVRAKSWGEKFAKSLYESSVLIIGGGGITEELIELLRPFGCPVTVVRRDPSKLLGHVTVSPHELNEQLPKSDFVVVAAALTDDTRGMFNRQTLSLMKPTAYLVNVARGQHVVTEDLIAALNDGTIAGAALDVTDPEPLPDGHPLWSAKNVLITPHTADTPQQVTRMFAYRIFQNTRAFLGEADWVGLVDPQLGY